MIRLQARVSVGYDLEGIKLDVDEVSRTIKLTGMGAPTILSMEHDVDYYDVDAGTFNPFTAQDLTKMEAKAKAMVRAKVPESGLFRKAADRKHEMVIIVRALVEGAGWTFEDATGPGEQAAPLKG
jgi:hypothetical protein